MYLTSREKKTQYNRAYYQKRKAQRVAETKGERSVRLAVQVPQPLMGRLHRLVNEGIALGKWPWRTMSKCVETLIIDGLQTRRADDTINEMLPHLEYMQSIDHIHQLRREAQSGFNKAREEINELLGIGADDGAVRYYHVAIEAAEKMPPTEWRDWMLEELRKAFPELARLTPKPVPLLSERKEQHAQKPTPRTR